MGHADGFRCRYYRLTGDALDILKAFKLEDRISKKVDQYYKRQSMHEQRFIDSLDDDNLPF